MSAGNTFGFPGTAPAVGRWGPIVRRAHGHHPVPAAQNPMNTFDQRLSKAIERGHQRNAERLRAERAKALSEEELRQLHTRYRLQFSEQIEQVPAADCRAIFRGFSTRRCMASGVGVEPAAATICDPGGAARRANYFSRLEMTIRPYSPTRCRGTRSQRDDPQQGSLRSSALRDDRRSGCRDVFEFDRRVGVGIRRTVRGPRLSSERARAPLIGQPQLTCLDRPTPDRNRRWPCCWSGSLAVPSTSPWLGIFSPDPRGAPLSGCC